MIDVSFVCHLQNKRTILAFDSVFFRIDENETVHFRLQSIKSKHSWQFNLSVFHSRPMPCHVMGSDLYILFINIRSGFLNLKYVSVCEYQNEMFRKIEKHKMHVHSSIKLYHILKIFTRIILWLAADIIGYPINICKCHENCVRNNNIVGEINKRSGPICVTSPETKVIIVYGSMNIDDRIQLNLEYQKKPTQHNSNEV